MESRVNILNSVDHKKNVLYLMNKDQRLLDNHSVNLSYQLSYDSKSCFFLGIDLNNIKMNERQEIFVLEGLKELSEQSTFYNIPFFIINDLYAFIKAYEIDCIVLDYCPIRESKERCKKILKLSKENNIALRVCDSSNIIPCQLLNVYKRTPKAVRTDLYKFYHKYLKDYEKLKPHKFNKNLFSVQSSQEDSEKNPKKKLKIVISSENPKHNNEKQSKSKELDNKTADSYDGNCINIKLDQFYVAPENIKDIRDLFENSFYFIRKFPNFPVHKKNLKFEKELENHKFVGGYLNGMAMFEDFLKNRFHRYNEDRNSPEKHGCSNLSPWLHAGQISAQKLIFETVKRFSCKDVLNLESFVNELFIWRETAVHFVYHEPNYDNFDGALPWVKETLINHEKDKRPKIYSKNELEKARTDDKLWNAAQNELVYGGKIHGYVRMYWAKKLLEWTSTAKEAVEIGVYLNDKYALDGNDCSGYLGVMWSLCSSMDRAFKERDIYGKIRYMRSIKAPGYIYKWI